MTRSEYWVLAQAIAETNMEESVREELLKNISKAFGIASDKWNEERFMAVVGEKCKVKEG